MSRTRTIESLVYAEVEPGYIAEIAATPSGKWGAKIGAAGPLGRGADDRGNRWWNGALHAEVRARYGSPAAALKAALKLWSK